MVTSGAASVTSANAFHFQSGIKATLGGKFASIALRDMNTLTLATPFTGAGPQQFVLTNPDGDSVSLDAAFLAQ